MYQALYRKYRPRNFDDVVGQEHITTTLKNEVETGKTSHAYLFTGSRGTGKTSTAKILAKAVNCLHIHEGNPCGVCEICRGIDEDSILDVTEIDAASNNGVDNIRDLREEAFFLPTQTKMRVYMIDETHMLSTSAFNALLKIMEEPPEHVLFILATTEAHKVPATILSRCQRFDFRRIPSAVIATRLEEVAQQEEVELEHEAALLIARLADGGMRDALSLLDLCLSGGSAVTAALVAQAAGLAGHSHLFRLTEAVLHRDAGAALTLLDELYAQSIDLERLCEEMISHFRNLMILKSASKPEELVVVLPDELQRMKQQAGEMKLSAILNGLTVFQETLSRMSRSVSRRTELEMALIRLCNPGLDTSAEAILVRLDALETALRTGKITAVPVAAPAKKEAPQALAQPETNTAQASAEPSQATATPCAKTAKAPPPDTMTPLAQWSEVLARLSKTNPALTGTLNNSHAYEQGDLCLIDCTDELFFTLIRQSEVSKTTLRDALLAETGKRYRLGPYRHAEKATAAPNDPADELEALARDAGIPMEIR